MTSVYFKLSIYFLLSRPADNWLRKAESSFISFMKLSKKFVLASRKALFHSSALSLRHLFRNHDVTQRIRWFPRLTADLWRPIEFNPLNPELNRICYLLALLGAHHFLHVSRIRVKLLTLRRLMSYIYGGPILDVSRSHTTTQHSR